MFNIALVSQIFWSYIVEIISGKASPKGYEYYIGFVIIITGIYLFNKYSVIDNNNTQIIDDKSTNKEETKVALLECNSETSSCSAFSTDKYSYVRNRTLSTKVNKYLNNN